MPSATALDFQRVARRLGFVRRRQTGSHERWIHPDGRAVTIPLHGGREIGPPPVSPSAEEVTLMPGKEIVQVQQARPNPNLSPAVRWGSLVFVSGQTGRHPATGEVGRDIREQTRFTLERIKGVLEAGTDLGHVLSVLTHLTRREDLAAYNEEYARYFPADKPARTTVTVASLNLPELLIEITVVAGLPG
jgi:2-iminobutanoate/2-iminopropanoate deaminase